MLGLQIRVRLPQDKRREFLQAVEFFSCQPFGSETCIQLTILKQKGEPYAF